MIIAVLGDIRGNAAALSRTLEAIAAEGILTILQAGPLLGPGHAATELIRCLRDFDVLAVQSPEDRALLYARRKAASLTKKYGKDAHARLLERHEHTPSIALEWIATLPKKRLCNLEGTRVLLCNGSPSGQDPPLGPDTPRQRLQREWERDTPDILLCGGVPAFEMRFGEVLLAAPGPLVSDVGPAWLEVDTATRSCLRRGLPEKQ